MTEHPESPAQLSGFKTCVHGVAICEECGEMNAKDRQEGGGHYKGMAIQPIEYILANKLPFIEGNIVKYITRWREKGGIEDLEKEIRV
jgi:hypothetical protein